jgi:osmotically-inducible protein OsmY
MLTNEPIPGDVANLLDRSFRRNAILDESQIQVTNSERTIYLDGTTDSWAAKSQAEYTAWQVPGVTEVVNRLVIAQ